MGDLENQNEFPEQDTFSENTQEDLKLLSLADF